MALDEISSNLVTDAEKSNLRLKQAVKVSYTSCQLTLEFKLGHSGGPGCSSGRQRLFLDLLARLILPHFPLCGSGGCCAASPVCAP